ncbi:MAG: isoleucine--tRNA ligase [Candidatus Aenigmatarchaeota archaeon]
MYNAKEIESKILKLWKEKDIPEKVLKLKRGKKFYFLDGPPYATGHIHMGIALNKILKDFYLRFFRMLGFDIWSQPGYDTHGLPIENQVQKKLDIKTKNEIEKFGIENFVKECRKFATKYIDVMRDQFLNLGVWMDWKNPYLTLTNDYIEGAWFTFKKAFDKGLLFKGDYPVHVCPKCETAVAYNEIIYKKISEESIYVKFPVKEKENEFLLIWTTTPWTLPANTGIMVHPRFEYSKVKVNNEILIIAKDLIENVMEKKKIKKYEIIETFPGKKLEGLEYESPLKNKLPLQQNIKPRVILSEQFVSLEEGSGLVHTAPGHGREDYKAGKEAGLASLSPLTLNGIFKEEAGFLEGKFAKDADPLIVEEFEKKNAIFAKEKITHDYPLCWRCETPLLMLSVPQWFFKVRNLRKKLLEENKNVNWIPKWAGKRFNNWLESLDDWPISRQRYWGIPLPIWICKKCNKTKVIGSIGELPEKISDIHRPYIDEIILDCECGEKMERVEDVLDVWFDSGVASWASLGYPKRKDLFEVMWPADLNLEGPDQIRGWWNSELITSVITFDKAPFKNILFHGFVLDAHGKKMSKSKGGVAPEEVIEKYGRDVLRYYFLRSDPSLDFYFKWDDVKEVLKFFTVFYNSAKFFETYCKKERLEHLKTEDKWLLSRVNNLIMNCRKLNQNFNHSKAVELIENFILEDLSHWYIKIIRDRTWPTYNKKDKKAAFATLYYALDKVVKLLAPICPFLAEEIYQNIFEGESVHLEDYPEEDKRLIDNKLEKQMTIVRKIVEASNAIRHEKGLKLKYTLQTLAIDGKEDILDSVKKFEEIIKNRANVKEVKIKKVKGMKKFEYGKIFLETKASKELKKEWLLRELIRNVQKKRKQLKLNVSDKITLYLPNIFKGSEEIIKESTGSKIVFGKISGKKEEFKFDKKKYEFGVEK